LCWKAYAARTVSLSCAAARGSCRTSITAGRKTFSRLERSDWLAIPPGPRHRTIKDLRREAGALKEVVAELTLENRLLKKKRDGGWGGRRMRYPASEKLEIIRLVEESTPVRRTLEKIGIPHATFYR
jgi:hypothetical protein